jgi:hypothetical protein
MQAFSELFVCRANFSSKPLDRDTESSKKLFRADLLHESSIKLGRYFHWQSINPATVDSRKAVPNTSQCQSMIPNTTDHVFGLP